MKLSEIIKAISNHEVVDDRENLQTVLGGEIGVSEGLCLDALGCVHDEQRPLAGGERAGHFVVKVHVAGGVDEIEGVFLAVGGGVVECHGVRLDGDTALAFQVHAVQQLRFHIPQSDGVGFFQQTVREGGFAVVNMGDDAKISDVLFDVSQSGTSFLDK